MREDDYLKGSFTFVMIPARDDDPIEEITRPKAGGLDNDEVRIYMQLHYGFTEGGRLVVTGLDVPRPGNNHTFVSLYSDSLAQDHFPVNTRATALATTCRHLDQLIYGDAFVSRSYGNDEARKSTW